MDAPRTILARLKHHNKYTRTIRREVRSAHFEDNVSKALSHIFQLGYFDIHNDNPNILHRVVWNGTSKPISCAPHGKPDAIAYAHGFCCLIEPTLRTNTGQCTHECPSSIRHFRGFIREHQLEEEDVYLLLVTPRICADTYEYIKNKQKEGYNFALLELPILVKILETTSLAFTIRHLEIRNLFTKLIEHSKNSSSLEQFQETANAFTKSWQCDVLKLEKNTFFGLKSYEAMKKIGGEHIGTTDIKDRLKRHPVIKQYTALIKEGVTTDTIVDSLKSESLGFKVGQTFRDELYAPVPFIEYASRSCRKVRAVGKAR